MDSFERITNESHSRIHIVNKCISSEIATRYCGELILFLFSYYTLFASPNYSRTNTRLRAGGLCKARSKWRANGAFNSCTFGRHHFMEFLCVIAEAGSRLSRKCERTCAARLESAIIQLHSFAELSGTGLKRSHPATGHVVNIWCHSMMGESPSFPRNILSSERDYNLIFIQTILENIEREKSVIF